MPHEGNIPGKPRSAKLSSSGTIGAVSGHAVAHIIPADDIKVENSTSLQYLRLRDGDFSIPKRVLLMVDGKWTKISRDKLPEER